MEYGILPAFVLDMIFGDPGRPLHPIRLIGSLIAQLEDFYRRLIDDLFLAGAALVITATATAFLLSLALVEIAGSIHPFLAVAAHMILIFYSISTKNLGDEAIKVYEALLIKDIPSARRQLSRLVGRDTDKMDETEIARATVETVAENAVDAIIAPLFYAVIGGGPLAMAYKAINTCDSMVGYHNERYEQFGEASAKLDDAANFIPARISIFFISAAAFVLSMDYKKTFSVACRDRLKHLSPNSGHPEAAFAGALDIQLGGRSYYGDKAVEKPIIGNPLEKASASHIKSAVGIMRITAILACLFTLLFRL